MKGFWQLAPVKAMWLAGYVLRAWWLQRCFGNREDLLRWQAKKLARHERFLTKKSPFYATLKRPWPVLGKADVVAHFDRLNTVGVTREAAITVAQRAERERNFKPVIRGLTVGLSSGTTGTAGVFLLHPKEQLQWLAHLLVKARLGPVWRKQKIALVLRANSNLYKQVGMGVWKFAFYDLMQPLGEQIEAHDFTPDVLVAPPSVLAWLADEVVAGRLKWQPKRVVSVAEVCDGLHRAKMVAAWPGVVMDNIYQATEGFLAMTCARGTLHLNEDMLQVVPQWVDEGRRLAMPVISDFSRKTQPYMHYRHDDVLEWQDEPCACGSVFQPIRRIIGRRGDTLWLRKGAEFLPLFGDTVERALLKMSPLLQDYRVVQVGEREFQLAVEPETGFEKAAGELTAFCGELGGDVPNFVKVRMPEAVAGVKVRRVQCVWEGKPA